ncbi:hypothetical protein D3273_19865 [Lichenibacterium minor]|jgi:hypothetical protein|uniref:Uncharacterized protein n=1 Tax=Lichenibacterium minor TaxID=2316528 RepID=A0A4Q2U5B5_9HYPH|nr:hypothetical protein [Lichenibacterium minor]RYC30231.1 hypothetical protein D3273_19865 [Lichenibacterium minor]
MTIEASDVVKLLRDLGRSDPTCHAMAIWADHASTPVLEVCHEALTRLAAEKARLAKVVEEMLAAVPAGTSIRRADNQASYGADDPAP